MEHVIHHVNSNVDQRTRKFEQICDLLSLHKPLSKSKLLDIGCGAGVIARQFHQAGSEVFGLDVVDQRVQKEGFEFSLYDGTTFPYSDAKFDIIVANYVYEHVVDQHFFLKQLHRTLKADGIIYFSVPNRYWWIEGHYHIPFLAWFPRRLASAIVRWTGRGTEFEIQCHSYFEMKRRLNEFFDPIPYTVEALHRPEFVQRQPQWVQTLSKILPRSLLTLFLPIFPGWIWILKKKQN